MYKILSVPLSAVLSITNNCNLRCLHCFSSAMTCDISSEYENWKKIIPILAENKILSIRYSGGEPLSVPWFKKIAEEVAAYKINSGMNTNATLVTPEIAKWLKTLPMRDSIIVGIDGLKESHEKLRGIGSFDKAITGLTYLVDNGLNTEMFCVITKLNYTQIPEIYELSKRVGVKKLNLNKLCLVGRSTDNEDTLVLSADQQKYVYETILSLNDESGYIKGVLYNEALLYNEYLTLIDTTGLKTIGCGNGSQGIVIYSDGSCSPCEMLGRNAICGNIFKETMTDIWSNSQILSDFRGLYGVSVEKIEGCAGCRLKGKCGGTCRAEAYIDGNIFGKGSMCVKDVING